MNQRKEETARLLSTLKKLEREMQYRGLKKYVRNMEQKSILNGKEKYILKGATAYLNRLQADRRSKSLGLLEFVPYDERVDLNEHLTDQGDFREWDNSVGLFMISL